MNFGLKLSKSGDRMIPVQRVYTRNPTTVEKIIYHPCFQPIVAWIIWMLTGTIFYAYVNKVGWAKGFYMAVNVGYSIGWVYPNEIGDGTRLFSTAYVLVGATAIAASLAYFASSVIQSSNDWYSQALKQEALQSATFAQKTDIWMHDNRSTLFVIFAWFVVIAALIAYSAREIQWDPSQAIYFALSACSTGGLWSIPSNRSDWDFGVVAVLTALGVPLLFLSIALVAKIFVQTGDSKLAQRKINQKVSLKEIEMMSKLGLVEGAGEVTRAEFILLCAVRLGALTPELINSINKRFHRLDTSGDGSLDYSELLQIPTELISAHKYTLTEMLQGGNQQSGTTRVQF